MKHPQPSERRNITQPADWWDAFESAAKKAGQNLGEWIGEAGKAKLPKTTVAKLSERRGPGQPRKVAGK